MSKEHGLSEEVPRESPIETDDPDAWTTATVGIVGTMLVILAVVLVQGLYESQSRLELKRKVVDEAPQELRVLRAAQMARLHETGWVDRQNGFVAIPIDRAMALLLAEPNPAAPIVVPEPPPTPATPAAPKAAR
jgi:hypothetical protein